MLRHFLLLLLFIPFVGQAQEAVFEEIQKEIDKGASFKSMTIFENSSTDLSILGIDRKDLSQGVVTTLSNQQVRKLFSAAPSHLLLSIPGPNGENIDVQLVRHVIFGPEFQLKESATNSAIDYTPGLHYKGVIKGKRESIAAFSFYTDEVMGLIGTSTGNINIVRGEKTNEKHLIYFDTDLTQTPDMDCGTVDDGYIYSQKELEFESTKDVGDCVGVYIEIDNDIVTNKGGAAGATNYVTALFNQSIILYANEQLTMNISEIFAWTTTSPYSSGSSSGMLNDYQNNTGAFNGDLSHLVSYQASGGIAAGFNGLCNSNVDNSKCFSSISSSFANVPNYSFSVMVVTHEMGHLLGSRHTHACVWNGNGTAIDGCAGGTEGSCGLPGSPANGGTIMSYCHLTTGIDFNQGFGPQPGNVIRNSVANASCLSACGGPSCNDGQQNGNETGVDCGGPDCPACPTCDDGVQNGNETGVDCGGPDCPDCPATYCSSNGDNTDFEWIQAVSVGGFSNTSGNNNGYSDFTDLTVDLEQGNTASVTLTPGFASTAYPEFWNIWIDYNGDADFDDAGELVYSGNSNTVLNGSFTVPANAPVGNSRMRISMRWNQSPPICGSFQYGEVEDYTVSVSEGAQVTCDDGIQNGDEEGVDCGGSDCPACPTCDDGIQNGDEEDVDCGGSICPACPTCDDGIQNGDEADVDCGGSDCPACPTCDDGIQNGNETGVDCGGPDCPSCPVDYCDASGNNQTYEFIQRVIFGTIDNNSGNNGGYADFTGQVANTAAGQSVDFVLTPGFASGSYQENWRVWIDYNIDGDFDDAGELVIQAASSSAVNGSINIPSNTSFGTTTMRVAMQWNQYANSCGTFTYGEVEDYSVSLSPSGISEGNETNLDFILDESHLSKEVIKVFPNPTSDNITITSEDIRSEIVEVSIKDLQGKIIYSRSINVESHRLNHVYNADVLMPGVYFVQVRQEDMISTKRIIVME